MRTATSALSCVVACVQLTAPSLGAARHTVPSHWPLPHQAAQLSVCLFVSFHSARYTFSTKSSCIMIAVPCCTGDHGRVPIVQRFAIIVMHKQGRTQQEIGRQAGMSHPTVCHWAHHVEEHKDVTEEKHDRPRCTDEALDTAIAFAGHVDQFTSLRQLNRKLNLDVSSDTIDRRLKEAGPTVASLVNLSHSRPNTSRSDSPSRTATRAGPKQSGRTYSSAMRPSSHSSSRIACRRSARCRINIVTRGGLRMCMR
jgi:uncharacterized protein YerC